MRRWHILGLASLAVIVLALPVWVVRKGGSASRQIGTEQASAEYVGKEACLPCHQKELDAWTGSDHDLAMDLALPETVLGDFNDHTFVSGGETTRFTRQNGRYMVRTEGPDGEPAEYEITHVFGFEPLQQYLVPFPGGRLQCLDITWDTELGRWFDLAAVPDPPPGDWLHWTRAGQNWNGMCAECHSTNLRKGYDPESDSYNTTFSEIDVSCETCHGPGSLHVAWANIQPMARPDVANYSLTVRTDRLDSRELVELCAPCHARRAEFGDYEHVQNSLMDSLSPSLLQEGLYHADGQILDEVYVYGSFLQSKMYAKGVRCSDCHDVHSLKLVKEGNDLCLQCHEAEAYDAKEHHFHKKIHEGKPSDGALCVKCHMPETAYMVVDERADHSIRVPRPDLSGAIGGPDACTGCHGDKPRKWSLDAYTKWYGLARKPHFGPILQAGRELDPAAIPDLARLSGDPLQPAIVRATALSLLAGFPGEAAGAAFARALADEEPLVRFTAVTQAPVIDGARFVDQVTPLLFDESRLVMMEAAVRLADVPESMLKPYQIEARSRALARYEEAMKYSLDFSHGGGNLGNLYMRQGKPEQAEAMYRKALKIDDLYIPAKGNLALLLNAQGRNEEAEKLLREILEAYPDRYEIAYNLGLLLGEMGRYEEAADYLEQAVQGMPDHAGVLRNLKAIRDYLDRLP